MSNDQNLPSGNLSLKLEAIATAVQDAVQACQGDVIAILALLRQMEQLHKEIRDGVFQENLPDNRQRLYSLLKDIESEGGWPYIARMRLKDLLVNLPADVETENAVTNNTPHNF